jgi:hypothetical protein
MRYKRNLPWSCPLPACRPVQSNSKVDGFLKSPQIVTPAKAGVQKTMERVDSRLRGNGRKKHFSTFF